MNLLSAFTTAAFESNAGIVFVRGGMPDQKRSYAALYSASRKMLGAFQAKGVKAGDELVIQTEDNEFFITIFLACIMGGIVPVPISCGVQEAQKMKFFKVWDYLNNPFLACDDEQFKRLELAAKKTEDSHAPLNRYLPASFLRSFDGEGALGHINAGDLAYIQFSSGSTGDPKGVCLTHDNLIANIDDIISSLAITPADRLLSWMPLTHDMGLIGVLLTGIVKRIDIVSIPTSLFVRRPLLWMEKTSEYNASVLYSPNFGLQYFLSALQSGQEPGWNLRCIRIIVNGAESISAPVCQNFVQSLHQYGLHDNVMVAAYGLAEASVEVAVMPVHTSIKQYFLERDLLNIGDEVSILPDASAGAASFVDVGSPISNCAVRICNNEDEELPGNTIGHIQIKGRNVTSGYYNNPQATSEVFTSDKWLRTGDLGFMHDGRMVITGRLKNIIIINGQNYYPKDIEDVLTDSGIVETGKVAACSITGHEDKEELLVFVLYKSLWAGFMAMAEKMKAQVLETIGVFASHVIPVKKFPRTTSGKIQYFELRDQYKKGVFDEYLAFAEHHAVKQVASLPGEEDIESGLVTIARQLLSGKHIDKHTNLLNAGMNSLLAMQFINRIALLTGKELPVGVIFQCNDIAAITQYISEAGSSTLLPPVRQQETAEYYELSLAQKRIWMECELNKDSVAYNVPVVYKAQGNFHKEFFIRSVCELVKRYEILRTSFETIDGVPRQVVHDFKEDLCSYRYIDLTHSSNAAQEADFFCKRDSNTPFLLTHIPQFRITILRLSADEYVLVFVIHHILTDGWSLQLLFKELCLLYNSFITGKTEGAALMPVLQFRDYAAWQHQLMRSDLLSAHRNYWLNELENLPGAISIPVQHGPASHAGTIPLQQHIHSLGENSFALLKKLAARHNTSRFSILATLLNIVLYRYTNRKDIVLGFDAAARVSSEIESLIGYTLNTLCLRTSIDSAVSFAELVKTVNGKVNASIDHQLYPFEQLMADKNIHSNDQRIFDILVLYQNFYSDEHEINMQGCTMQKERVFIREGFVNLLLDFTEEDKGLDFVIHYNETVYCAAMIERFAAHLARLLDQVSENDTVAISTYDFLTADERRFLLPSPVVPPVEHLTPVHILFERSATSHPDVIALSSGTTRLTYHQLNERANAVADFLRKKTGVAGDDRVGFMVSRNENMIIALLGILKSGAAYVAIDPQFPIARCEQMVADSEMKALLTDSIILEKIKDHFDEELLINIEDDVFFQQHLPDPPYTGFANSLAYIIYTSGSTGKPKGVMIEQETLSGYVQQFTRYFGITRHDVFIQQGSVSFDVIVEEIFPALCVGAKIVIAEQGAKDIDALLSLIAMHNVTVLSTTPMVLNHINEHVNSRISSLRLIISGGDVLHSSDIDKLLNNVTVYNTYGPSEATVCATYKRVMKLHDASLIGKPVTGSRIYILDENRQVMPKGCTGEIYIQGGLARGYLGHPGLTEERFISSPFDRYERLYRSGDLGRWTEQDDLEFIGRNDEQVKIRGIRIETGEIEQALLQYEPVKSGAVVVQEDAGGDKKLLAFVVVKKEYDENELRACLLRLLPSYMIPSAFILVPAMPLSSSGKIDRQALRAKIHPGLLSSRTKEVVAPETKSEKLLAGIWSELLNRSDISAHDNFFDIGGHSLKANQLVNKIYQRTGVEVSLADVFSHATIREQGALVSQLEQKKFQFIEVL